MAHSNSLPQETKEDFKYNLFIDKQNEANITNNPLRKRPSRIPDNKQNNVTIKTLEKNPPSDPDETTSTISDLTPDSVFESAPRSFSPNLESIKDDTNQTELTPKSLEENSQSTKKNKLRIYQALNP